VVSPRAPLDLAPGF